MRRSVKAIEDHIKQVSRSLHDSQEHSSIVRLEARLAELHAELRASKQPQKD